MRYHTLTRTLLIQSHMRSCARTNMYVLYTIVMETQFDLPPCAPGFAPPPPSLMPKLSLEPPMYTPFCYNYVPLLVHSVIATVVHFDSCLQCLHCQCVPAGYLFVLNRPIDLCNTTVVEPILFCIFAII